VLNPDPVSAAQHLVPASSSGSVGTVRHSRRGNAIRTTWA